MASTSTAIYTTSLQPTYNTLSIPCPSSSFLSQCDDITVPKRTAFDHLVDQIRTQLGSLKHLKSSDIDTDLLQSILNSYTSSRSEWEKYSFIDLSRNYTRNLVDDINSNANLIIMTWTPGKSSLIHDHTNAHCIMRVLQGELRETKYEFPKVGVEEPLKVKEVTHFRDGEVTYINDDLGLHKVENSHDGVSVSLHLYTPPYIQQKGCNTFNAKTGKSNHISLCDYYSKHGKRDAKC